MRARRIVAVLVIVGLAALLLWWLFEDTFSRRADRVEIPGAIRFLHFAQAADAGFWNAAIADFEAQHPGTRIVQQHVPGSSDYNVHLRQLILTGDMPEIALVRHGEFHELAAHFEDLSPFLGAAGSSVEEGKRGDFSWSLNRAGVEFFRHHGIQRGLPVSGGNLLIFINLKSVQKAAKFHATPAPLPVDDWSVKEFLRLAEFLTCDFDRDGKTDQFGLWLPRWADYLPFIWSFGADLTDQDTTQWVFAGPNAQAVMRFYRQLATGDRVAPRLEEIPQDIPDAGFLRGQTAMCVHGPWFLGHLAESDIKDSFAVAPIPRGPGGRATWITWDGIVLRKGLHPQQRDAAWRFVQWTLSREVQARLARLGRTLPARMDAVEEFVRPDPPRRQPFVDALAYSRLQPLFPRFEAIDRALTRHFGEVVDPTRAFEAVTMLEALARDPAIVSAFPGSQSKGPPR